MRRFLALLLLATGFVLARPPALAGACSCVEPDPADQADWADVVFAGTVTDARPEFPEDDLDDAIDRTIYTFTVDRVYEGEVATTVEVVSATDSATCGADFDEGRYLVYAAVEERSDEVRTGLCNGNRSLDDGEPGVPVELGDGVAPAAAPPGADGDGGRSTAGEEEEAGPATTWPPIGGPDGDVEDASALDDLPVLAVGAGVVALVVAGVVLLVRWRRPT